MRRRHRYGIVLVAALLVGGLSQQAAEAVGVLQLTTRRIAGADRYATAVAIAREACPGWNGVRGVVIASGEEHALSDALVASALTYWIDGPLLLVGKDALPPVAAAALEEMASAEPSLTVVAVGGPGAVSDACLAQVAAIVGDSVRVRRIAGRDRFATAAAVAVETARAALASGSLPPEMALVVNGEPTFGLADALSASAVAAATGAPVLYIRRDAAPAPIVQALRSLDASRVVVIGGSAVVPTPVANAVGASARWWGADRCATAVAVARAAHSESWMSEGGVVVAGSVADAVASGPLCARTAGPLLLVPREGVPYATAVFLGDLDPPAREAIIVGGKGAVSSDVEAELKGAPHRPAIASPSPGSLTGAKASVLARTGVNTVEVRLYRGASLVATRAAAPFEAVSFGTIVMPEPGMRLRVVALSSGGETREQSAIYRRLKYPASTSIVIDKSDFRLYWVRNDVLVRSYPIAIGRPGMETPAAMWRVGAKYVTDPAGVYGPRKMRLFRRVVSGDSVRYVYTRYGIHGTNQPWVIGTKASHGCIRMYNRDVLELYPQVPHGTLVQTRE